MEAIAGDLMSSCCWREFAWNLGNARVDLFFRREKRIAGERVPMEKKMRGEARYL
jgi:hypothetical protein